MGDPPQPLDTVLARTIQEKRMSAARRGFAFTVLERSATEATIEVRRDPTDVRTTRIRVDEHGDPVFEEVAGS